MIRRWIGVLALIGLLVVWASRTPSPRVETRQVVLDGPGTLTVETDRQHCFAVRTAFPEPPLPLELHSPDGAWQIRWGFPADRAQGRGNSLVLTETATGRQQGVPVPDVGEEVDALQWSPDSTRIAIVQQKRSPGAKHFYTGSIAVLTVHDLTVRTIAQYAGSRWELASPDSQRLAYIGGAAWEEQFPPLRLDR